MNDDDVDVFVYSWETCGTRTLIHLSGSSSTRFTQL